MLKIHKTRHHTVTVDGLDLFVRSAGDPQSPTILLLHGFPSSSHMFRNLIPELAQVAHVIAPDLPGFGFSAAPAMADYRYTFANLATTLEALLEQLGVGRYFLYLNDFGTPVGYHLATRHPDRVQGLIVQNGNAHPEGLGPQWDAPRRFWAEPTEANRAQLPDWLNFAGTREQYLAGLPDAVKALHAPELWHLDWERLARPGDLDIQFQLFTDYAAHVARFEEIADYHRHHQPRAMVLWGRYDTYFDIEEVLAYHRELKSLEVHVFDGGHFLLETHVDECASVLTRFVRDVSISGSDIADSALPAGRALIAGRGVDQTPVEPADR